MVTVYREIPITPLRRAAIGRDDATGKYFVGKTAINENADGSQYEVLYQANSLSALNPIFLVMARDALHLFQANAKTARHVWEQTDWYQSLNREIQYLKSLSEAAA